MENVEQAMIIMLLFSCTMVYNKAWILHEIENTEDLILKSITMALYQIFKIHFDNVFVLKVTHSEYDTPTHSAKIRFLPEIKSPIADNFNMPRKV